MCSDTARSWRRLKSAIARSRPRRAACKRSSSCSRNDATSRSVRARAADACRAAAGSAPCAAARPAPLSEQRALPRRRCPLGLREHGAPQVPRRALRIDVHEARHDRAPLFSPEGSRSCSSEPSPCKCAATHRTTAARRKPNRDVAAPRTSITIATGAGAASADTPPQTDASRRARRARPSPLCDLIVTERSSAVAPTTPEIFEISMCFWVWLNSK